MKYDLREMSRTDQPLPIPNLRGENDNNRDSLVKTLVVEADGIMAEYIVAPEDEEELMDLICAIAAGPEIKEKALRDDIVTWRTALTIVGIAGLVLFLAFLYV